MVEEACKHVAEIKNVSPKTKGCGECEKIGSKWVAIRLCLTCGEVGCCDSSEHTHARKHFEKTKHPIITDLPDKSWKWCYIDDKYI